MFLGRAYFLNAGLKASNSMGWLPGVCSILLLPLLLVACAGGDRTVSTEQLQVGGAAPAGVAAGSGNLGVGLSSSPAAPVRQSTSTAAPTATPSPAATLTTAPSQTPTAVSSLTPTATPLACWEQGGRFEYGSLRSDLLKLPMEYSVYLPPCYDQQPESRYPVLYMIHGMNYNNDQWDRLGADETADSLVGSGDVNPFIIVMPRDRSWEQPEEDPFGQVLVDSLVPYIDEHYRTLPERRYRAVGGLSRGAGWAVHLGLSRWDLFGAIGGHSLPVFWSDTGRVRGWLAAIPPGSMPRIYLDIGEKDRQSILQSAQWFEGVLTEAGIPHEWYLFTGYHEEAYWQAHVEDYLRWYAAAW
jgi:enterochelin esterase-like enzyme